MTKWVRSATVELFETHLGSVASTRARRKARLVVGEVDDRDRSSTWPRTWTHDSLAVVNHGGVFSANQLDVGTRLLLDSLPADCSGVCVDLGCGNGVVGAALGRRAPEADVVLMDNQHRAVVSAQQTWEANHGDRPATTLVRDGLLGAGDAGTVVDDSVDLVVCNPPFHDDNATTDEVAWRMFTESRRALRPGGELRVVGNRHLGYSAKLSKIFGNVEVVASNAKFSVLSSIRA